jgi:hypothetical protein
MTDQLERSVREALSHQDAQLDQDAIARLRAVDYHPRRRTLNRLPAFGVLGTAGTAAAVAVAVSLSSGAAPAFAGWQATPTTPTTTPTTPPAAPAGQSCGQGLGTPTLTDARGPYTAAIYVQGNTTVVCMSGDSIWMSSTATSSVSVTVAAGQLQFGIGATRDSAGNQLTLADGRVGTGVSAVSFDLSDGTAVQATVSNGWYMAWWPGTATATNAEVTTAGGTTSVAAPAGPGLAQCPKGADCSGGYSEGSSAGGGRATSQTSIRSAGSGETPSTPASPPTAGS